MIVAARHHRQWPRVWTGQYLPGGRRRAPAGRADGVGARRV